MTIIWQFCREALLCIGSFPVTHIHTLSLSINNLGGHYIHDRRSCMNLAYEERAMEIDIYVYELLWSVNLKKGKSIIKRVVNGEQKRCIRTCKDFYKDGRL